MEPGYISIIIILCTFVLYVTELLPIPIIALASTAAMVIFGAAPADQAWAAFGQDSVLLMGGMLAVGAALFSSGAVEAIADMIERITKGRVHLSILVIYLSSCVLSSFLNNTTVTVMFLPLLLGIVIKANDENVYEQRYVQALSAMTGIGGMMTLVGSGVNVTASGLLEAYGYEGFSFFMFLGISIPMLLAALLYIYTIGDKIAAHIRKKSPGPSKLVRDFTEEYQKSHEATQLDRKKRDVKKMRKSTAILILTAAALMSRDLHGVSLGTIGVTAAVCCVVSGCLSLDEMIRKINWNTLLILGGMIGCAKCLAASGGGLIIANFLLNLFGDSLTPYLTFAIFTLTSGVISQFLSNTGTVGMLIPICIPIAQAMGASPVPFVVGITLAASCSFATPMASHIQALIIDWGSYKFIDFVKYSAPLTAILLLLILILTPMYFPI